MHRRMVKQRINEFKLIKERGKIKNDEKEEGTPNRVGQAFVYLTHGKMAQLQAQLQLRVG